MAMLLGWSAGTSADESFWSELPLSSSRSAAVDRDVPLPSSYRAFTVDLEGSSAGHDGSGGAPTSYAATCTDGANAYTATSATFPITVSGLKNDVAYTCNVVATNNNGSGGAATASSTITPEVTGLPIWLLY